MDGKSVVTRQEEEGRNCRYSVYRVVKNHHPLLSQELMCISDSGA